MPGLIYQTADLEQCIDQEPDLEQQRGVALISEEARREGGPAADVAPNADEDRERRHRKKKEKKERKVRAISHFEVVAAVNMTLLST